MSRSLVLLLVAVTLLPSCVLFPDNGSTTSTTLSVSSLLDSVPDSYSVGLYSVKGFVKGWRSLDGSTLVVRGVVVDSYSCPPCPPGAMCAPCRSPRITLADPVRGGTLELVVDFGADYSVARSLIVGEEVDVVVKYSSSGGGVSADGVPGVLSYASLQRTGRRFVL
jgi:hypothetical protein